LASNYISKVAIPFDYSTGREIDGIPVSEAEFQRRIGNGNAGAAIFRGGKYVGFIDLSRRPNATHVTLVFDLFRSGQKTPRPEFWYYLGIFALEIAIPGAQRPEQNPAAQNAPNVRGAKQQNRFDAAWNDLQERLLENNGDNPCAALFGGLKKAQKALSELLFNFDVLKPGSMRILMAEPSQSTRWGISLPPRVDCLETLRISVD
jgi:hypothetical protein